MKTLFNIFLCAFFILIISVNSLPAQSGHSSQSSQSSRSFHSSQSSQTKTENRNSSQNSDKQIKQVNGKTDKKGTVHQKENKFSRTIELNGETDKKEIIVAVSEKETELTININTIITKGELMVEIYDPTGEKQGNCSIDCPDSIDKNDKLNDISQIESASCSFSKSFNPPLPGDWEINIHSKKAKGTLKIEAN